MTERFVEYAISEGPGTLIEAGILKATWIDEMAWPTVDEDQEIIAESVSEERAWQFFEQHKSFMVYWGRHK